MDRINYLKKSIFLVIPVSIIAMIIISCERGSNCKDNYFSQEFKDYVYFSEGSYWVYIDTIKNITDSIYLLHQEITWDDDCTPQSEPHEELLQKYTSTFCPDINGKFFISTADKCYYYNFDSRVPQGFSFSEREYCPANYDIFYYDSLFIYDRYYYNIKAFIKNEQAFYWSKGVGMVKRVFNYPYDSDTIYYFEIIRHN